MIAILNRFSIVSHMHRRFYNDSGHVHFLTFSCYHKHHLLTSDRVRTWLAQSIDSARAKHGFSLWAYVFMPNHVHLIIRPNRDDYSISKMLRDIKEPTSQTYMAYLRKNAPWELEMLKARQGKRAVYRMWQAGGGFDRNLIELDEIEEKVNYVELNPVRRGYVERPTDWVWSSARARADEQAVPLTVDPVTIDGPVIQR